jgi:hypothetical protein
MKDIILTRFAYSPLATFGTLKVDDFECYTVERPWLDNKAFESCIPEGEYAIELGRYNRGGYAAYEIKAVPDRTHIKIHIGNTCNDVVGCIGLGERLGSIHGEWAVLNSRNTYQKFMEVMDGETEGRIIIDSLIFDEIQLQGSRI